MVRFDHQCHPRYVNKIIELIALFGGHTIDRNKTCLVDDSKLK